MTQAKKKLRETDMLTLPTYNPANLLDKLTTALAARGDYSLSAKLSLPQTIISKIRHRRIGVTASVLLRMHDVSGLPVNLLRTWMGVEPFMAEDRHD